MDKENEKLNPIAISAVVVIIFFVVIFFIMNSSSQGTPSILDNTSTTTSDATTNTTTQLPVTAPPTQTDSNSTQQKVSSSLQIPTISDASGNLSPSVIAQIEPAIVEINCYSYDNSIVSSGSGVSFSGIVNSSTVNAIMTNYHVYAGAIVGGQQPSCDVVFPEPPDFSYNWNYGDYQLTLTTWHYNPNTYEDAAIFTLGAPVSNTTLDTIPTIENVYKNLGIPKNKMQCSNSDVNVGDSLTIFGYPHSGNLLGISETVTEGIISGIITGPIYKTNAAIDHGNSGGLAILNKNGCSLGIPTLGASGLTSGIGYIQSYSLVKTPVN